ncbi:hypothetical protein GCM10027262_76080 [Nocardia tengchongensis]
MDHHEPDPNYDADGGAHYSSELQVLLTLADDYFEGAVSVQANAGDQDGKRDTNIELTAPGEVWTRLTATEARQLAEHLIVVADLVDPQVAQH